MTIAVGQKDRVDSADRERFARIARRRERFVRVYVNEEVFGRCQHCRFESYLLENVALRRQ
jgi:hypothetical protein